MQDSRGPWFLETTEMLRAALGSKPSPAQYRAVLSVLYKHMSDRNLADAVGEAFGVTAERVLNDIYDVVSRRDVSTEDREYVTQRLSSCGFAKWKASE